MVLSTEILNKLKEIYSKVDKLTNALDSIGTDKFLTEITGTIPISSIDIEKIAGTQLTGRDWSVDFEKLQNLDVALSTRASETTLSSIKTQTDKLTFDANKFLKIALASDEVGLATESTLSSIDGKVATEATLSAIKNALASVGTDKLLTTPDNPPNLDVALSTRASEATLSNLNNKFPSATTLSDTLTNPTTTIVGSALLGWDSAGAVWERIQTDGSGRLKVWLG